MVVQAGFVVGKTAPAVSSGPVAAAPAVSSGPVAAAPAVSSGPVAATILEE